MLCQPCCWHCFMKENYKEFQKCSLVLLCPRVESFCWFFLILMDDLVIDSDGSISKILVVLKLKLSFCFVSFLYLDDRIFKIFQNILILDFCDFVVCILSKRPKLSISWASSAIQPWAQHNSRATRAHIDGPQAQLIAQLSPLLNAQYSASNQRLRSRQSQSSGWRFSIESNIIFRNVESKL